MLSAAQHPGETPWLDTRFGREFQFVICECLLWTQWVLLGPTGAAPGRASDLRKALWRGDRGNGLSRWFGSLLRRETPETPRPDDPAQFVAWAHDFLARDWNQTYREIGQTGTLLGYLAGYLSGNLKLPEKRIRAMNTDELSFALQYRLGTDLAPENRDELVRRMNAGGEDIPPMRGGGGTDDDAGFDSERAYAVAYAARHGGEWVAIYETDPNSGEPVRAGRPYEIVSRVFRRQITEAIAAGESVESLRSRMVFPDLLALYERGEITEAEYMDWADNHLNRDFSRFALTEANFAWSNGKLSHRADLAKATGQAQYLQYRISGGHVL